MTKYIDAERLREEIKSIEEDARKVRVAEESTMNQKIGADGQVHLCQKLNLLIDSLQKEQPEEPKIEIAEYYYQKGVFEGLSQGRADALKILEEFMKRKADPVIVIKQQEHMMKEAVEIGTAQINWEQDGDRAFPTFDPPAEDLLIPGVISQKFNDGDKVKIIIVKED